MKSPSCAKCKRKWFGLGEVDKLTVMKQIVRLRGLKGSLMHVPVRCCCGQFVRLSFTVKDGRFGELLKEPR